ncbi:MAG: response regulator transcription factor [Clostridiales bacterium]|nr:response regulator transcription factor [Clostridiales bacterium]MCF8021860.1 response regulator transcription factor [Clostridiales bacterium]
MAQKVLIVDDEESIVRLLSFNLEKEGFVMLFAYNGEDALSIISEKEPDLVILDIMLPQIDGFEVCRRIRQQNKPIAVIMLTAKDQEIDTVLGLELGADDYIVKPFSPRELVARVRAVLRRTKTKAVDKIQEPDEITKIGNLTIDSAKYEITVDDRPVELTPKEFELLDFMVRNAGRVMSRDALLDNIWGYTYTGDTRIVDVHMSHLREKIEKNPRSPVFLKTVRGVGYKFKKQEN